MTDIPVRPKKAKRYDWHRRYFKGDWSDRNPIWEVIADRAQVDFCRVLCIKNYLDDRAAEAKAKGYIGEFDVEVCAKALKINDAAEVVSVVRVLLDKKWLSGGHVITDWLDRNPPDEDQTATERQRRKRALDDARTRIATGCATADDLELISKPEQEQLARLAALASRVTGQPIEPARPDPIAPFVLVVAKEESHAAVEIARQENERNARLWLLGDGVNLVSYGTASRLVADTWRCTRLSADAMVREWLKELDNDCVVLATIISGAFDQALTGDAFKNVVVQRIEAALTELTKGPPLPLGIGRRRGGSAA